MNGDTIKKLNGAGTVMRFVTPVMVGIVLAMVSILLGNIKDVQVKLDNHLQHEMKTVCERLSGLEATQKIILRYLKGGDNYGSR